MDTAQWPQELVVPSGTSNSSGGGGGRSQMAGERRARPQKEQALNCPRCNSTNTKFCYYNNYSLTQPRYFCKTCRRYWTEGGSLRNVPVGGGSRKNKRPSSSSAAAATANTTNNSSSSVSTSAPVQNPKFNEGRDLNLSFPLPEFSHDLSISTAATAAAPPAAISAMELLRSTAGRGLNLNPFAPMNSVPMPEFPSAGFVPVHDYRSSSLSFPLDAGYVPESRLLFPFDQDSRPVNSSNNNDHNKGQEGGDNPGFWNGMMGGSGGGSGSW